MSEVAYIARDYAREMHAGQVRKYTGDPYFTHPQRVAGWMSRTGQEPKLIAAAYLHDVIEDTPATYNDLLLRVGKTVADLVLELTDVTTQADGNRATRKEIERNRLANCSAHAQTVKMADLIDNTEDIVTHDPKFAKVYLPEAEALFDALDKADPVLRMLLATRLILARQHLAERA